MTPVPIGLEGWNWPLNPSRCCGETWTLPLLATELLHSFLSPCSRYWLSCFDFRNGKCIKIIQYWKIFLEVIVIQMVYKFSARMKYNYSLPVAQNATMQQSERIFSQLKQIHSLYTLSPKILSIFRPVYVSASRSSQFWLPWIIFDYNFM